MALSRDVRSSVDHRACMQIAHSTPTSTLLSIKIRLKLQINILNFLMNLILKKFLLSSILRENSPQF